MPDETSIGQRIQAVRKRRGLTQDELARAAGVSRSLVCKLEQGEINDIRLETAHKIAAALGVPTSSLMPRGDAPVPAPESLVAWQPVRRALDGAPDAELPGEPTLEGVRSTFRGMLPLLLGSRFAELGVVLPALRDADALVAGSVNGNLADARALRAQIRQVAGALMLHTWQFETADKAFGLAMSDADDVLIAMSVVEEQCWGLIRQGKLAETRELAFLDIASRLTRARLPVRRYAPSHRLDVAQAHVTLRQYPEAVSVLQQLRQERPEWLPRQRHASDILEKIIQRRRTLTPEMRELADFMHLGS